MITCHTLLFGAGQILKSKNGFSIQTTDNVEHVTSSRHSVLASNMTNGIQGLRTLRRATKLKYFPGLWRLLRRFEPISAKTGFSLNFKLGKDQPFSLQLSEEEPYAMKSLQDKLVCSPLLPLPYGEVWKTFDTASCYGEVEYLWLQEQPDKLQREPGTCSAQSPAHNSYTIQCNENIPRLYGWFYFFDHIWKIRVSQPVLITTHWSGYRVCRTHSEDSRRRRNACPNLTLMSITNPALSNKQSTHCRVCPLMAERPPT